MSNSQPSEIRKFITFSLADYWYVIPVTAVLKIVNCPPPNQGGIVGYGVVQLGVHTIQLLDMHHLFGPSENAQAADTAPFLIVLQSQENQLWGITLETPPDLIELPVATLKPVSLNATFKPQSPWISHVGVVTSETCDRTLLRLDLKAIFQDKVKQLVVQN